MIRSWFRWGGTVLRPQAPVPRLATGAGTVPIGHEVYVEWRTALPAATATMSGAVAWKVLDADLAVVAAGDGDASAATVPAGGYLVLFGDADDAIGVTVR